MSPDALTDQLSLFLDVLETGSFSAAARRHPLTPSAVARRIDNLETAVGSRLFSRSTHAVRATPAGNAFAERARRIIEELRLARAEAVSLSNAPEGLIRIDAPAAFGRRHLAPAIADFLVAYPGLDVQLRLIDSFVDLHGSHLGEVDLVLRAGPWPTPAWSLRRWPTWYASPAPARLIWPAEASLPAPANCPGTTAWTGTAWHRRSPGASP